ncbi:hypothetical protein [Micromonospora sp. NPDC005324]|uniref:hypothetical protein n=1 Tax=Micromonospora sp. NPDC005324 TaxID=3157033 RepID=UPI0033A00DDC
MAFRTWGRLLLTALGVSVLAGAGQLGVAYGFGIVRLTGAFTGTTVNQWPAQLVWVGWFAANAAVAGAVLTGRLARRDTPPASTGRQLAVGGAAALGATVIAPLCMQPARAAELISVDPVWAVGICAMVGAVIGAGAAIAVLFRPELGWNMAAVAGAVWLLALISVLPSLGTVGPLPTVRLGVLEPSWLDDAAAQRLALLLLPIVALLAGAATAGLARWRGQAPLVSGATGVAGPVLVAFAYLTAGPGDAVDRYQAAPYYGSLIAILAGALGAAAAALLRWPTGTRAADPQAIEPTAILRPLPAGPALPSAANDRDSAERTDTETTNAELATAQPGGVVAGPWAAGDPDSVRTVPAHWDWPETTASGQHGPAPATASSAAPTPAAPTRPAAWLTAPTGEFSAAGQTLPRHDDVPATTEPSASTDVSKVTDASATGTTAGRVDAATPTGGRAADTLTGSTATGTSGSTATSGGPTDGRTTRRSAATPSSTGAQDSGTTSAAATSAPTSSDAPSPATGSTARTSAAATSAGSAGTSSAGTSSAGTSSAGTSSAGTGSTGMGSTQATSAGTAGQDTPEAPPTIKPRRSRKPKANPDATASDVADDTSSAGSATTSETTTNATTTNATTTDATTTDATTTDATPAPETTTGRATKGTRPGRSADSTGSDAATMTPSSSRGSLGERSSSTSDVPSAAAAGTAAAARTTAAGAKRAPATPVTGSKRPPAASTTAATGATQVPADPESPTTATDATQTPTTVTPAPTTANGATPATAAPTTAAGQVGAEATARVPKAGTGSTAAPADATSGSAIAGARGTDSARPAAEDVPTAGLFGATAASDPDADRWTPAPSAWPVTPTWTVPPQASEPEATTSESSSNPDEPTGPTPRPRHRAPLPDLSRAGTWNAFDTSRRRGTGSPDSSTARTAPTDASETAIPAEHPAPTEFPGTLGAPSDSATISAATADSATAAGAGAGTGDLTPADAASATPTPPKVAEQPSRRGRLGGLFRRNRSRADEESPKTSDAAEPLATQDEEFVDWVAGLSKPVSDNEPEQENGRRSLRSTGRHHRD